MSVALRQRHKVRKYLVNNVHNVSCFCYNSVIRQDSTCQRRFSENTCLILEIIASGFIRAFVLNKVSFHQLF